MIFKVVLTRFGEAVWEVSLIRRKTIRGLLVWEPKWQQGCRGSQKGVLICEVGETTRVPIADVQSFPSGRSIIFALTDRDLTVGTLCEEFAHSVIVGFSRSSAGSAV